MIIRYLQGFIKKIDSSQRNLSNEDLQGLLKTAITIVSTKPINLPYENLMQIRKSLYSLKEIRNYWAHILEEKSKYNRTLFDIVAINDAINILSKYHHDDKTSDIFILLEKEYEQVIINERDKIISRLHFGNSIKLMQKLQKDETQVDIPDLLSICNQLEQLADRIQKKTSSLAYHAILGEEPDFPEDSLIISPTEKSTEISRIGPQLISCKDDLEDALDILVEINEVALETGYFKFINEYRKKNILTMKDSLEFKIHQELNWIKEMISIEDKSILENDSLLSTENIKVISHALGSNLNAKLLDLINMKKINYRNDHGHYFEKVESIISKARDIGK